MPDVDMSIWAMCRFIMKWSIAASPAGAYPGIFLLILLAIFDGLVRGNLPT